MIKHSVIFSLRALPGTDVFQKFFKAASDLQMIPDVKQFEILKQVSTKNDFDYGISMSFDTEAQYAAYNHHPDHQQFITDYWIPSVEKFLEIDYKPFHTGK